MRVHPLKFCPLWFGLEPVKFNVLVATIKISGDLGFDSTVRCDDNSGGAIKL
jgi:hypothetical protein